MSLINKIQSFLPHLDEFRRRLIVVLLGFIVATLICYNFAGQILPILIQPATHLVFTSPLDGFSAYMTIAAVMGFILSLPLTLHQVWSFIGSALRPQEKQFILLFAPLSFLFFLFGVAFAFFVAIPLTYKFLMSFSSDYMQPMITVSSYMGFLANMLIAFGVTFELPLILAFLAKIGIASPEYLRQKRRHAIMIIFIIATIITPPDIISQVLLALPLILLYELGIVLVGFVYKHKTL